MGLIGGSVDGRVWVLLVGQLMVGVGLIGGYS